MDFLSFCSTTFITCPAEANKTLAIKLPFLVMIIKNLKKYFTFEVQVMLKLNFDISFQGEIGRVHERD